MMCMCPFRTNAVMLLVHNSLARDSLLAPGPTTSAVCIRIYICICLCMYIYICIYTHIYIYAYMKRSVCFHI